MSTDGDSQLVELLDRARNGDEAARYALFDKCRTYIKVVAQAQVESWLQAKVDASDLVQQTLLEAYRGFSRFRGQTQQEWLGWLRMILKHNALDYVRQYKSTQKRQAHREKPLWLQTEGPADEFLLEPSDKGDSPSELVMQREREIQVAEAISKLDPDHQEVVMLRNLQRLPFDEVAVRMGRSRAAAQMLWMRALQKLQHLLEDR